MKLDTGAWAIFPQQRVTGNRSHSICHNKVILSPASGRRYRCNSHPLLQKSNLLCTLQYMRVSVPWTLQRLFLITVKYRDGGSCHYNLSLQQAWFWCRLSLIMFHETSLQKASSWGEQGSMMGEQHFAVEERTLCSTISGGNTNIWRATPASAHWSVRVRSCEAG